MAIHPDLKSLLSESVQEYLAVAKYCVAYRKDRHWGEDQVGGCFGYPAAVMLFSIVDTIGSFHRGRVDVKIEIDGKSTLIRKDGFQHFFILNSEYYGQRIDEKTIKKLYDNFRNLLVHNASLAPENFLENAPHESVPFPVIDSRQFVNLPPFLEISRKATRLFLNRLDGLVPGSEQARNIGFKK